VRWQGKRNQREGKEQWAYRSHSAIHKVPKRGRIQTSTLLSPLRYALHADSWLVVQTMLASGGQNEIDVDDGNHAVN